MENMELSGFGTDGQKVFGLVELPRGQAVKCVNDRIMEMTKVFNGQDKNNDLRLLKEIEKLENMLENMFGNKGENK